MSSNERLLAALAQVLTEDEFFWSHDEAALVMEEFNEYEIEQSITDQLKDDLQWTRDRLRREARAEEAPR